MSAEPEAATARRRASDLPRVRATRFWRPVLAAGETPLGMSWRAVGAAALLYAAYAIFLTWPLATNPGGLLPGVGITGDTGGSVGQLAYVVQHNVFPFAPATLHGINAPEGLSQAWVVNVASFPGQALQFGLGYLFGAVAGSNVFLWLNFVLSGLSMFVLTRRLFGSFGAALLAGFAFAFYPFAVDKLNGHFVYMDGWVLVIGVWRMLELAQRPTVRNSLLAGAAAAFGMWWTPYFILIGGVAFAVMEGLVVVVGLLRRQFRAAFKSVVLAVVPIVLLFGSIGVLVLVAGGTQTGAVRTQSIQELYTYSARWLEWLLPDRNNLIFGGSTGPYLTSHLHGSNFYESSLYLGLSVLALGLAGAALAARRIGAQRREGARDPRIVAAVAGLALAVVAAWFSSPPRVHVLGVWVPTPSDAIFQFTSTWRVYTRFVELIELGLCIPMAFAVARLLARSSRAASLAVFAALAVVLVLDLWARPTVRTVPVTPPAEYGWLHAHPGGIVADYPIEPAVYPEYAAIFWQSYHGHPIFQGYETGTETESIKLGLADLREPRTASYLAALHVRYVVVHPGYPGYTQHTIKSQHYLVRFVSPSGIVLQVGARPARTRVDALDNFWPPEGTPGSEYRWMGGPGVLGVQASACSSCTGQVDFGSGSNDHPRILTVREQETGRLLLTQAIPAGRFIPVHVPNVRLITGQARLVLTTNVPPNTPTSGGDIRSLSINVQEPRFTRAR